MKTIRFKHSVLAACAALALAAPASLFATGTADFTIQKFTSDISGCGSVWGPGVSAFDSAVDHTGDAGGSLHFTTTFSSGSDTPMIEYICAGGGNPWHYIPVPIIFSTYSSVEFDIKWDPASTLTVAEFNDLSTYPSTDLPDWGPTVLSGSTPGIEVGVAWTAPDYSWQGTMLATTNIPAAAATGWAHVSVPINPALANIDGQAGIYFHKWINNNWAIIGSRTFKVWIDNVYLKGTAGPPPPPIVSAPNEKAQPGLNIWLASANSAYDRQEVCSLVTNGLSWVGHATPANPVTYSFTVTGYPNSQNCQLFFLLSPNPAYMDNALDWNETNCVYVEIQGGPANATMSFKYKVNEAGGQDMYGGGGIYTAAPGSGNPESGMLATVSPVTGGVLGTWQIKFTSDTAGEIIAPDNTTKSFTMPAYNATKFAENPAASRPGVYVYLGGQMNTPEDAANQAFVFSNFSITGTPGAFSENFLTDTVLDTTKWAKPGSAPIGTFILPAADAGGLWLQWTLPASGFSLQSANTLGGGSLAWTSPTAGPIMGMIGVVKQLVPPSEIPAGDVAFFRLIKRTFTKLQILLPGETAAPNTSTGKTGTPDPQQGDPEGGPDFNVIVNAVDDDWNVVNSGTDSIHLTCTDSGNFFVDLVTSPPDLSLSGGTVTFPVFFTAHGSSMITATDVTDGSKTADTSATVNY